jgi:hypothetical protein
MALLDERLPHWVNRVDPRSLNMGDPLACVVGQVFGSWIKGGRVLGLSWDESIEHGFEVDEGPYIYTRYAALTREWRDAIEERQDDDD